MLVDSNNDLLKCVYVSFVVANVAECILVVVVNVCGNGASSSANVTACVTCIGVNVCGNGACSSADVAGFIASVAVNVGSGGACRSAIVTSSITSITVSVLTGGTRCTANITGGIAIVVINVSRGSASCSAIVASSIASVVVNVNNYLAYEAARVAGSVVTVGVNVSGNGALCSAGIASSITSIAVSVCACRTSSSASIAGGITSVRINVIASARKEIVVDSGTRCVCQERTVSLAIGVVSALMELLGKDLDSRGGIDVLACGENKVNVTRGIDKFAKLCGSSGAVAEGSVLDVENVAISNSVSIKCISNLLLIARADVVLVNTYNDIVKLCYRSCLSARVAGSVACTAVSVSRGSACSGTNVTGGITSVIVEVVATARYEIVEQSCCKLIGKKCAVSAAIGVICTLVEFLGDDLNACRGVDVQSCGKNEVDVACGVDERSELLCGGGAVTERSVLDIAGIAGICQILFKSIGDFFLVACADIMLVDAYNDVLKNSCFSGVGDRYQ